jgi:DNA-binding response OmpR family regulator
MKRQTVLVSEDEVEIRELLAMLFKAEGYTVLQAPDGQTALDLVRENKDSIILLVTDLGLPKLGGLELIKEARRIIPSLKIIAASGFGHASVRSELRDVGVEEFFPKPFSPLELLETAKRLLAIE